jgi:transcriptional regulator with XRE-family HTH domain
LTFNQSRGIIWVKGGDKMSKIGENIRRIREKNGLTQEELAHRMGYKSKSTINKIELGINDIPQSKIVKFAQCLNTTPAVLMGWVSEETNKKNDAIVDIVMKLRKDDELLSMMEKISKLDADKRQAINSVLNTYGVTEK